VIQVIDEFNRPAKADYGVLRVPPPEDEVEALFAAWRVWLPGARKFLPAARDYLAASLWRRTGLRIRETYMLDIRTGAVTWRVRQESMSGMARAAGAGAEDPAGPGDHQAVTCWTGGWPRCGTSSVMITPAGCAVLPSERHDPQPGCAPGSGTRRCGTGWRTRSRGRCRRGRGACPASLRHFCASSMYARGMDLKAIQELLGHEWLSTTTRYIHVHADHIEHAWANANARVAARLGEGMR